MVHLDFVVTHHYHLVCKLITIVKQVIGEGIVIVENEYFQAL